MAEGVTTQRGRQSALNITGATLVKPGPGRVATVLVNVAGAAGTINDTLASPGASNLIFNIPAVAGAYQLDFPFSNGLYVTPGSAQIVAVSFD